MGVFDGLLNAEVVLKEAPIDRTATPPELFPEEEKVLARAVLKRRVEFAVGRTLAREALAVLGWPNVPIPSNEDRSPVWPDLVVGSITHCNSWCVAGVATQSQVRFLGLDLEEFSREMKDGMIQHVCAPVEIEWLSRFSGDAYGRAAMAIFSAKEAWYKACYPETGCFLDLHGARIEFDSFSATHATWRGILLKDWGPFNEGEVFPYGRSRFDAKYVASAFVKMQNDV